MIQSPHSLGSRVILQFRSKAGKTLDPGIYSSFLFTENSISTAAKPNTQYLSWFYGEDQKGTLRLNPKYQRNPIWSEGQKCFLIDSVISGCPIPQVYINILSEGKAKDRKTVYEVVDG